MDLQLQGKRALVTGSTSGIGEAIAKTLAAEGAAVVIHGRGEKSARWACEEIRAADGKVAWHDLSDDVQAAEATRQAQAAFDGGIDILVNNAGASPERDWFQGTPAQWGEALQPERALHRARGSGAGAWGNWPMPGMPDYAATKAANLNQSAEKAKELLAFEYVNTRQR